MGKRFVLTIWLTCASLFVQAQHHVVKEFATGEIIVLPVAVEQALDRNFPLAVADSGSVFEQQTMNRTLYELLITHQGKPKLATFDELGRLLEFQLQTAPDTLPVPVLKTLVRSYRRKALAKHHSKKHCTVLRKGGTVATLSGCYGISAVYAKVDKEGGFTRYTIVVTEKRNGNEYERPTEIYGDGSWPTRGFR